MEATGLVLFGLGLLGLIAYLDLFEEPEDGGRVSQGWRIRQ